MTSAWKALATALAKRLLTADQALGKPLPSATRGAEPWAKGAEAELAQSWNGAGEKLAQFLLTARLA